MGEQGMQSRRKFIVGAGSMSAATIAVVAGIGSEPLLGSNRSTALGADLYPKSKRRAKDCAKLRQDVAQDNLRGTPPDLEHPSNGDEDLYGSRIANYTKGLPHNDDGTVVENAYASLLNALRTGHPNDFDALPLGGSRTLTNPQSGLAFDLEGADAHSFVMPPAPGFASREQAAEIAENYWMALLRDLPFAHYNSDPIANAAAADLTHFGSDFTGAKSGGIVTTGSLFRGLTPGDAAGPYLSQFFYQPCFFGANEISQKIQTTAPGLDYMTSFNTGPGNWLDIQRGIVPSFGDTFDPTARYIRNGRDLGQWVHVDVLFQAYFHAFLILAGSAAPVDEGNPYANNRTQHGFGTFGGPHIATLLCEVATRALKAVWFQKWFVHRRLRPEAFAARVDRTIYHGAGYPIHSGILDSLSTSSRLGGFLHAGNGLLPIAFPEGCPTHPSYGAGHGTVAGACVTILKAWFNESTRLVDIGLAPVEPTDDGLNLVPYSGSDTGSLTVGGELNKLASNIGLGRDIAGLHWRSDATESLKLGEAVAISVLRDQKETYNEAFEGFSLTTFEGNTISI
jgi:hypothetical protein